jgi:hypothetical protein
VIFSFFEWFACAVNRVSAEMENAKMSRQFFGYNYKSRIDFGNLYPIYICNRLPPEEVGQQAAKHHGY